MSFSELGLAPELLRAVEAAGYHTPSPIQAKAIPACLEGRDVLAAAQTGTGKTAGFTLPILQRLSRQPVTGRRAVRALILTPTRELAAQVHESVEKYGAALSPRLESDVVYGGVKINPQINRLREGVDILVACPGRLLDLVSQKAVRLDQVETLVLDEADRMLDMGFIHDIRKILKLVPQQRQTLLFSATFSSEIRQLADKLLDQPVSIDVAPRNTAAETVDQSVYKIDKPSKTALLVHLIRQQQLEQALVFTATKHMANRVTKNLQKAGITAAAIHGNKSQNARTSALNGFKSGEVRILVATDVAARGIDIAHLPHVINFELPNVPADYVHRIGRTGRAGASGSAMSLVAPDERDQLKGIERLIGKPVPVHESKNFDARAVQEELSSAGGQTEDPGPPGQRRNARPAGGQRQQRSRGQGGRERNEQSPRKEGERPARRRRRGGRGRGNQASGNQ
ncbi:DEAD/DEAH box helicase [Kushneria phosphatilytica]|uniref:DEAD-box ATP-dependent RNA helicase RhpA n=1 Tax=Kushneria phosphatilytica TaxID=657387 RepID=A0A1S1NT62_9GAMM|nr:DEAD/DEAH box helicase [Kushneria phosphatilytica]OHV08775.1 ATP-dependent RNA helicase RhlE [Kushneria phosphatilytica]QEL12495.1 DEAD/DEAH box helicase [Kushneria phosphatilytica]